MGLENRDLSDFEKRLAKFRGSLPLLSGPRPSVTGHCPAGKQQGASGVSRRRSMILPGAVSGKCVLSSRLHAFDVDRHFTEPKFGDHRTDTHVRVVRPEYAGVFA